MLPLPFTLHDTDSHMLHYIYTCYQFLKAQRHQETNVDKIIQTLYLYDSIAQTGFIVLYTLNPATLLIQLLQNKSFRPVAALVHKLHYFSAQCYGVHHQPPLQTLPHIPLPFLLAAGDVVGEVG